MRDFKKINISITGDESNRNEIIYNNVISNMSLTEEEQIKYLKNKATTLELELKNRKLTALLAAISVIGISFGIALLMKDVYFLGSLLIAITFVGVITRFYLMYKTMIDNTRSREFEKVESLKNILEDKLR